MKFGCPAIAWVVMMLFRWSSLLCTGAKVGLLDLDGKEVLSDTVLELNEERLESFNRT